MDDGEAENGARKKETGSVFKAHIASDSDVARGKGDEAPPAREKRHSQAGVGSSLCVCVGGEGEKGNTFDFQPILRMSLRSGGEQV